MRGVTCGLQSVTQAQIQVQSTAGLQYAAQWWLHDKGGEQTHGSTGLAARQQTRRGAVQCSGAWLQQYILNIVCTEHTATRHNTEETIHNH